MNEYTRWSDRVRDLVLRVRICLNLRVTPQERLYAAGKFGKR